VTPDARIAGAVAALHQQYTGAFAGVPQLYNGPEYVDYTRWFVTRTGHQYFPSADKEVGNVRYNGHLYRGLPLRYDVVRDQLVTQHPTSPLTLALVSERVQEFSLGPYLFVRLPADSAGTSDMTAGFYQVLADGHAQVLAKRLKRMQTQTVNRNVNAQFYPKDKLYIKKAGLYYPVDSKGSVRRLFADREKEVQRYLKEQKLKFNKTQLEASVVLLTTYYNSLPPR
jgi:hypothetical protein